MVKKCLYCKAELSEDSVIDFCHPCGTQVWGEKMLGAIVKNMEDARSNDDLCDAGRISKDGSDLK